VKSPNREIGGAPILRRHDLTTSRLCDLPEINETTSTSPASGSAPGCRAQSTAFAHLARCAVRPARRKSRCQLTPSPGSLSSPAARIPFMESPRRAARRCRRPPRFDHIRRPQPIADRRRHGFCDLAFERPARQQTAHDDSRDTRSVQERDQDEMGTGLRLGTDEHREFTVIADATPIRMRPSAVSNTRKTRPGVTPPVMARTASMMIFSPAPPCGTAPCVMRRAAMTNAAIRAAHRA